MDLALPLLVLLVLGLPVALVLIVCHARVVFVIRLQAGRAHRQRGRPSPSFVNACTSVARLHRLDRGRIMGVRTGEGVQLRFSADIPERARQAFRNVWTPPPGGSGGGHRATG